MDRPTHRTARATLTRHHGARDRRTHPAARSRAFVAGMSVSAVASMAALMAQSDLRVSSAAPVDPTSPGAVALRLSDTAATNPVDAAAPGTTPAVEAPVVTVAPVTSPPPTLPPPTLPPLRPARGLPVSNSRGS